MRVVVQKFGGSLLESPGGRLQVAELITATRRRGRAIVAVVSAIGREGNPYATDTLMGLMREIGSDIDPRTLDLLLSTGEIISTAVLAHTLVRAGCPAIALTGAQAGILTSDEFNDARILRINPTRARAHLERDRVVVVKGTELGVPIIDGQPVIALAHLPDVVQLKIARKRGEDLSRPLGALAALAEHGISIDLITLLPEMLAFTVKEEAVPQAANLLSTLGYEVQVSGPCAKVSIIGAGMRGRPGVMARVVKALHDAGTEILQTADSHTTISCLVWREQLRALVALHDGFGLGAEVASEREAEG